MIESVQINMTLTKDGTEKHKKALSVLPLPGGTPVMLAGDELKVNYEFNIRYLGNVAECLEAVNSILEDRSVIRMANLEELRQGRCLIQEIMNRLQDIQRTLG